MPRQRRTPGSRRRASGVGPTSLRRLFFPSSGRKLDGILKRGGRLAVGSSEVCESARVCLACERCKVRRTVRPRNISATGEGAEDFRPRIRALKHRDYRSQLPHLHMLAQDCTWVTRPAEDGAVRRHIRRRSTREKRPFLQLPTTCLINARERSTSLPVVHAWLPPRLVLAILVHLRLLVLRVVLDHLDVVVLWVWLGRGSRPLALLVRLFSALGPDLGLGA